ncbi:MAG: ferritin-like domain-containing protein [Humibacillus sp.]|nr:ferritin-like domain-containing protein [Humibacillus sp.]MDN5777878.1 ferritin-like domain-containing protein [Humibacillus sp.]
MFGKKMVVDLIDRSAENERDRRNFIKAAGLSGLAVAGTAAVVGASAGSASAHGDHGAPSDAAILNFALNLEYLEGQFYSFAVHGCGIPESMTHGTGKRGRVIGGHAVPFKSRVVKRLAEEIAGDELAHVTFLRSALGSVKVSQPQIDLQSSFTAAAMAAGLITKGQTFDPFANEDNFLLGAFIFEDVGVTAYKGAAPLISNKTYLEAAAGILSVEAYHAGIVRLALFERGLQSAAGKISNARDSLDGRSDDDQGLYYRGRANFVPTDANGITYSRSAGQVLNIAYLNPEKVTKGGFFPAGVNGVINTSADSD